jgi:hypothetical protein
MVTTITSYISIIMAMITVTIRQIVPIKIIIIYGSDNNDNDYET